MVFLLRPPITVHMGFAAQFYKSPRRLASEGPFRERWREWPIVISITSEYIFQQSLRSWAAYRIACSGVIA
jgi:hypothetical protein